MTEPLSKPPAPSLSPPSSPPRPVNRIHRSITEVSPPAVRTNRPHHHHHLSHHHFSTRRARSSDKERNQEPESAYSTLQPFLARESRWHREVKSEFGTPAHSANASRRASGGASDPDFRGINAVPLSFQRERRFVRDGEVKEERQKGILRAAELRSSLMDLNTLSNDATRRLDVTYYSVLEKLTFLQSSIDYLKEVAALTRNINSEFQTDSGDLVQGMREQIEGFSNFESQERRIKDLADRVQAGRGKIHSLGERADAIEKKVEGYERAEAKWQEKTRRRLRTTWIIMSVIAVLAFLLWFFGYKPAKTSGPGVIHGLNTSELSVPRSEIGNETWIPRKSPREGVLERLKKKDAERDDDSMLRVFDEL